MFMMIISQDSCKDAQFADELALAYISNSTIFPVSLEKYRDISPMLEGGMYVELHLFLCILNIFKCYRLFRKILFLHINISPQRVILAVAITWRPSSSSSSLSSINVYILIFFSETTRPSSLKPLGQLEPNLIRMFIGWSYTTFMFFC